MTLEVLDSLPIIDESINEEITDEIEALIEVEMQKLKNEDGLHSYIQQHYPEIPSRLTEKYNLEMGIDSNRYTEIDNDSNDDTHRDLQVLLSYSILRHRNLEISLEEMNQIKNQWLIKNDYLERYNEMVGDGVINHKKRKLDELKEQRVYQSREFKDLNEYFENKWRQSVKDLIDLGIEIVKLEN